MNTLRNLPSVDHVLSAPACQELIALYGRTQVVEAIRTVLESARMRFLEAGEGVPNKESVLQQTQDMLRVWLTPTLTSVINATGVIVHTNLGRAPLSLDALTAVNNISGGYSTLEFDMQSGGRGSRLIHAEGLFQQLLDVEAALVVNNNASAVLLALTVLTRGKKVIISRSQLVEIGGGFRIPDVLKHSGTDLVEVGTTNKVHLYDYENAYEKDTVAIMRAHTSNYAIVGFTSEPDIKDIAESAHQAGLLFIDDLGSGALLDTSEYGLKPEPTVQESLSADADLVCFSGDKLLGGPQAGIILGKNALINQLKSHPLARAIRADKMALSALTATLGHYLRGEAVEKIPVWQMISSKPNEIKSRAESWQNEINIGDVIESKSMIGGGSLPGETLPTWVWAVDVNRPQSLMEKLRSNQPAIIARVENDQVVLDPRTVRPDLDHQFTAAFSEVWSNYED
jgi:L-seryl-tRNA(Ser) seleniumtransferase